MRRATKKIFGQCRSDCGRLQASWHATAHRRSGGSSWPQFGKRRTGEQQKLKDRDLVFILRNLATLTESGVSLPKALGTLAEEKALEKHRDMLQSIRRHLENGETFSTALAHFGATFDTVMVNQIKVGEHSGTLGETLTTIARHREEVATAAVRNHSQDGLPGAAGGDGHRGHHVSADVRHSGVRRDVRRGARAAAVHHAGC